MEKLISAESLLLSVRDDPEIDGKHFARIKEHISHAPDVNEVVHSRWENIVSVADGWYLGFCANCRTEQTARCATALKAYHKYCRWCGARMDGAEDGK